MVVDSVVFRLRNDRMDSANGKSCGNRLSGIAGYGKSVNSVEIGFENDRMDSQL